MTSSKGNESHVNALLERGHVIIPLLLKGRSCVGWPFSLSLMSWAGGLGLCDVEMSVVGACLHSLNAIYQNERKGLPVHWIYEVRNDGDKTNDLYYFRSCFIRILTFYRRFWTLSRERTEMIATSAVVAKRFEWSNMQSMY